MNKALRISVAVIMLVPVATVHGQGGRVQRLKVGDTSVVRTTGNGTWGAAHDAVELKRVGNATRESTFGRITSMAALPGGAVAVFDDKSLDGPIARLFDPDGRFVRNIGRIGSGPGEYRNFATLTATPSGKLMIADPLNARGSIYSPDGRYLSAVRFTIGNFGGVDMVRAGLKGDFFVRTQSSGAGPGLPTSQGFIRIDSTGRVLDTVPPYANAVGGGAFTNLFLPVFPDGRMVLLASDRVAFLIRSPRDIQHPTLVALDLPLVNYLPEERAELQATRTNVPVRGGGTADRVDARPVPPFKRPFTDVHFDGSSTIWVRRSVTAVKGARTTTPMGAVRSFYDPVVYDAFQPDGTFLGEVRFPANTKILAFSGNIAWGWLTGDDDQIDLVKYRVR